MGAAFLSALGSVSVLHKALFFTSLFTGPLLALFLMAFFFPRLNGISVGIGALLGMATLLPFLNIPLLPPGLWEPWYRFSWPWNPLISLTATLFWASVLQGIQGIQGGRSALNRPV
jgi:SSS family solute:Na+ symporter